MGGNGSGQYWRYNNKGNTEDFLRIDVLSMNRDKSLKAGVSGLLRWSRDGETQFTIKFQTRKNYLRLTFKSRFHGEELQDVGFNIPLSWTDCRFGGKRPYFLCPSLGCGKRVQHLYLSNPYFVCRHCLNLAYRVQREAKYNCHARKAEKLRKKLGLVPGLFNGPPIFKPKYMHQKTWDSLRFQLDHYTQKYLKGMAAHLDIQLPSE